MMKSILSLSTIVLFLLSSCSLDLRSAPRAVQHSTPNVHLKLAQTKSRGVKTEEPPATTPAASPTQTQPGGGQAIEVLQAPTIGRYEISFQSGTVTKAVTTSATLVNIQVPAGTWTLVVSAFDSTTGGNLIGQAAKPVTVVNGDNNFDLTLYPLTAMSGTAHFSYDWAGSPYLNFALQPWSPTDLQNENVVVAEISVPDSGSLDTTNYMPSGSYTATDDGSGRYTATFDANLKSGTYLAYFNTNAGTRTELVKIYDHLQSGGHVNPLVVVTLVENGGGVEDIYHMVVRQGATVPIDWFSYTDFYSESQDFLGWNTIRNGSGQAYNDHAAITPTTDVTLYAQWGDVTQFMVTFDFGPADGHGNFPTTLGMVSGETYMPLAYSEGEIYRTDYTFEGWSTGPDGTGDLYSDGSYIPVTGYNYTLYAVWQALGPSHYITLDPAGGTSYGFPSTVLMDPNMGSVYLPYNDGTLARDGYQFTGWNTDPYGWGTSYGDQAQFPVLNYDVTLYAQWTALMYDVTFIGNGSDFTYGPLPMYYGGNLVLPSIPEEQWPGGFIFAGWLCADGDTYNATSGYTVTSTTHFTAMWGYP